MDMSELRDKALASIDKVMDGGKDLAGKAADRAKALTRLAKLRTEISTEKENLRKTYLEMGKLYYDVHKDDPEGFFIQLCDEVALSEKNIADKEALMESLRSGFAPAEGGPEVEVDFESIVSDEESAAASSIDEAENTVEEALDEAEDAVQEVREALDELSDSLKKTLDEGSSEADGDNA